jgi:NitT/TauT family transport system substrate-binding protein
MSTLHSCTDLLLPIKRRLIQILSLLAVLFHLPAASAGPTQTVETVTIAQFGKEKFLLYLPLYVAMERGLFEKRQVQVKLQFAGNDDQIFASVIRGDALFGVGDPVFAAISREKGGPGKVVALMVQKLGLSGVSQKNRFSFINTTEQLRGLRISSFPSPSTTYTLLSQILHRYGLTQHSTRIVQTAIGTQLAALEAGQVDIALDLEPAISVAESKGYSVSFLLDTFTEPQAITGLTTLQSTIETRGDLVQKVVSALDEALKLIQTKPFVAHEVAKKLFPTLSDQVIHTAVTRMLHLGVYPDSTKVDDSLWQTTLKTRLESGDLKAPQDTSFTVDNSFAVKAALEEEF